MHHAPEMHHGLVGRLSNSKPHDNYPKYTCTKIARKKGKYGCFETAWAPAVHLSSAMLCRKLNTSSLSLSKVKLKSLVTWFAS